MTLAPQPPPRDELLAARKYLEEYYSGKRDAAPVPQHERPE